MLEKLLALVSASPKPYIILHPDQPNFTIAGANNAFYHVTNLNKDDITGKAIFDAFPQQADDSGLRTRKIIQFSLEHALLLKKAHTAKLLRYDLTGEQHNSETRFWNCDTYPVLDCDDHVHFIVQNPVDVTHMVISDLACIPFDYRLLDKNFQHPLFDKYPDAICTLDLNGNFLSANKVLSDLLESNLEEILKRSLIHFVTNESFNESFRCFQKSTQGEIQQFECDIITAKGIRRNFQITHLPLTLDKQVICVYTIAKDITSMIKKELELIDHREKLEQYNEQLTTILEGVTDGFLTIDFNWNVNYWNTSAEKLTSANRQDVVGKNLWSVFSSHLFHKSYTEYQKAMTERISVKFEEYFPLKNLWFEISAFPSIHGVSVFF